MEGRVCYVFNQPRSTVRACSHLAKSEVKAKKIKRGTPGRGPKWFAHLPIPKLKDTFYLIYYTWGGGGWWGGADVVDQLPC